MRLAEEFAVVKESQYCKLSDIQGVAIPEFDALFKV
jgi:hypothetical protein